MECFDPVSACQYDVHFHSKLTTMHLGAIHRDAEERDLVIEDAHARNLFVNLDCWNRPPLQNHRHRIPTAETADNGLGAQRVAKKDSKEETDKKSFEVTGSTAGASPVADSKKKYLPPPSERR